jgi:hypothetical protein
MHLSKVRKQRKHKMESIEKDNRKKEERSNSSYINKNKQSKVPYEKAEFWIGSNPKPVDVLSTICRPEMKRSGQIR